MQKIILLITILLGLATLNGCSKTETTKTTVEIVVKDASGNKSNITVYQIGDTKYNMHGADPFFKDQQSVTDNNGLATFTIADIDFATGGQRTYYFFATYTITTNPNPQVKTVGITLSKGDKKSDTLLLN